MSTNKAALILKSYIFAALVFFLLTQAPVYAGDFADYKFTNVWDKNTSAQNQKLKIVLDLDNTLVWKSETYRVDTIHLGKFGEYDLFHGALEVLAALSHFPDIEIIFFSAGLELRNRLLINEILDLVWAKYETVILPRYYSRQDLSRLRGQKFGKKDLNVLGNSIDLSRVFLVDDNPNVIMPGQETNWVGVSPFIPVSSVQSRKNFYSENKLIPALGVIVLALENSTIHGISPVAALKQLTSNGAPYSINPSINQIYFDKGLLEIRKFSPGFGLAGDFDLR